MEDAGTDALNHVGDSHLRRWVEIVEWFIQEKNLRIDDHRSDDANLLSVICLLAPYFSLINPFLSCPFLDKSPFSLFLSCLLILKASLLKS